MTKPLALLCYERLLPGGQLVSRLEDLGYRAQAVASPATLAEQAERETPLLVLADLEPRLDAVCAAIARLKANPATAHIPVIAFAPATNVPAQNAARAAGAVLAVTDAAIVAHLNQFLEQALRVD